MYKHAIPFFLSIFLWTYSSAQVQEPTISTCEGVQQFCLLDSVFTLCVRITVDPAFPAADIDFFEIDWDDGSTTTVAGSANPEDQFHDYDFASFLEACLEESERDIFLTTVMLDGTELNNGFKATFLNYPVANFFLNPGIICEGSEVSFIDDSCPTPGTEITLWFYGINGESGTEPMYEYPVADNYTITGIAENICGADTATQTLSVIEAPIADPVPVDGILDGFDDPFIACLNNGLAVVSLDGDSLSINETEYDWDVIVGSSVDYDWLGQTTDNDIIIQFYDDGIFEIELTVNNACQEPSSDILIIEVIESQGVIPDQVVDACDSLSFTPEPFSEDMVYSINGEVVSSFPILLQEDTYILEASMPDNICFTVPYVDTFIVFPRASASILEPDTSICSAGGDIELTATPADQGEWFLNGTPFNGVFSPSNPNASADEPNEIIYGGDGCLIPDTMYITLFDVTPNVSIPEEFCLDEPPSSLPIDPAFGTWSGIGVVNGDTFDPSIPTESPVTLTFTAIHPQDSSCAGIFEQEVIISDLMVAFAVDSCFENTVFFDTLNTSQFTNINWEFGAGLGSSNEVSPSFDFGTPGMHDVTVTIQRGECEVSYTETINIEPAPVAAFSLQYDTDGCSPLEVTIIDNSTGNNLNYEWDINGEIFNEANPGPITLEAIEQDTTFTFSLTLRNDCSNAVASETVLVRPIPRSLFGTDLDDYCSGDTIYLSNNATGNPEAVEWYYNNDLISTGPTPPLITHFTDTSTVIEICMVTTNSCGIDTLCRDIPVGPTDVVSFFNTSPDTVCLGDTIFFTNFATANVQVVYDFGDGTQSGNPNPFHVYQDIGTYTVTQKAFGCGFDSTTTVVNVLPIPEAGFSSTIVACVGTTVSFSDESSGSIAEYSWDFGDGIGNADNSNPTYVFDSIGVFEVCLSVTSENGCTDIICQNIEIVPLPNVQFSFTDSICAGQEVTFINESPDSDIINCRWDFGDGNIANTCNPTHIFENPGPYTVCLELTNSAGCIDTLCQLVYVRVVPISDFEYTVSGECSPVSVSFQNNSLLADAFFWDFGDGDTSVLSNPTHIYESGGTFIVSLQALSEGVCVDVFTEEITIAQTPTAIAIPSTFEACAPATITFMDSTLTVDAIESWEWSFGDSLFAFEENPVHTYEEPGTYIVQFSVQTAQCADDTLLVPIEVYPPVEAEWTQQDLLCFGDTDGSIDLTVTNGTPAYSYDWSNSSELEDQSDLSAGNYSVTITDVNSCILELDIEIIQPDAISTEVVTSEIVSCFEGTDGALEIIANGGTPDYVYNWDIEIVGPSIENVPAGIYSVNITDANNCGIEASFEVLQNAPIIPNDSVQHITCFGFDDGFILLEDNISGGVGPYVATTFGPRGEIYEGLRLENLGPGTYEIEIQDANGCIQTYDRLILEPDSVFVDILTEFQEINLGEEVALPTNTNAAEPIYEWFPKEADEIDCFDCPNPVALPFISRTFQVFVTDNRGCINMDTVSIRVKTSRAVYIPDAFTPDGSGFNDLFRIRADNPAITQVNTFRIYDRWGELIYEAADYHPTEIVGWDGTFHNQKLPAGTFVYYAEVSFKDGFLKQFSGEFILIR